MQIIGRRAVLGLMLVAVAGCGMPRRRERERNRLHAGETVEVRRLINKYSGI